MATDPALQKAVAAISAELATVKGQLAQVQRNQRAAQLGNASIDGGALVINDELGNGQIILGLQADGTWAHQAVGTGSPAAPSAPFVSPLINGLLVGWDGTMADATLPTADFSLVEIHISTVSGFTPGPATLQGTMTAPGTFPVSDLVPYTPYFAALVIQNAAGVEGPGGAQAEGIPVGVLDNIPAGSITAGMISFSVAGITVTLGAQPSSPNTGDLWYDSSNGYVLNQWNGVAWTTFQFGTNAIAAGSVTAALIAANTITAAQIAAGTITGTQIAAATITASLIAAGTIQGTNIAAGTITSDLVSSAAIVAGLIDASAIDGFTINGAVINGSVISAGDLLISGSQGGLFAYGSGGTIIQTLISGTHWVCPADVTSILIEGWAPGGGGGSSVTSPSNGGGTGGGGGEYAAEPAMGVTAGNSYVYSLGSIGVGALSTPGTDATNLTFTGDTLTLTAHGGKGGGDATSNGGLGGRGSGNTVANQGGDGGGQTSAVHGIGGGSSGTPTSNGRSVGQDVRSGASAPGDGGPGGEGGGSVNPDIGSTPLRPGGGGGGGGTDGTANRKGGNGAPGQIRITYTPSVVTLVGSLVATTGLTDPIGGVAVPEGLSIDNAIISNQFTAPDGSVWTSTGLVTDTWHTLTPGNSWSGTFKYTLTQNKTVRLSFNLTAPATAVNNVTIVTLPSGYRPASAKNIPTAAAATQTNIAPSLNIDTAGVVSSNGVGASSARIAAEVEIPLDT